MIFRIPYLVIFCLVCILVFIDLSIYLTIFLLILLLIPYKDSEEDCRELIDMSSKLISDNLFICKFIAVDIYLLLVCFFHTDLWLFIISLFFVVIYLLTERFKDKKEQVGIDVCIVPVITTIFAGVFSFYANNISVSSSFFPFYNVSTHLSLSSEPKGILSFLTLHIAACVGWVTFWAFWSQIKANALTVENFEKQQITEQYFEMMKAHLNNVKELNIIESFNHGISKKLRKKKKKSIKLRNRSNNGIDVFDELKRNYEKIFKVVKKEIFKVISEKSCVSNYKNTQLDDFNKVKEFTLEMKHEEKIRWFQLQIHIMKNTYYYIYECDNKSVNDSNKSDYKEGEFKIRLLDYYGFGYRNKLTHYYRNLFKVVKYIVNQDKDLFKYEDKRDKLGMLRVQMNNTEQLMLFYNWISSYGEQWENAWKEEKDNKFLTDYRMIHNLHYDDLDETIFKGIDEKTKKHLLIFLFENLGSIFCDSKECNYKAKNYNKDLFEFEDWD